MHTSLPTPCSYLSSALLSLSLLLQPALPCPGPRRCLVRKVPSSALRLADSRKPFLIPQPGSPGSCLSSLSTMCVSARALGISWACCLGSFLSSAHLPFTPQLTLCSLCAGTRSLSLCPAKSTLSGTQQVLTGCLFDLINLQCVLL